MEVEKLENITLYNADCMEVMKTFKDKQFSLAICDPPYGIGFSDYERGGAGIKTKTRHTKNGKKNWDNGIPTNEYFEELFRVSQNQIIWGGNYFEYIAKIQSPNLKKIEDFKSYINNSTQKWLFWYKQNPVPNFADGELAWISFEKNIQFDFRYYGNIEGHTSASEKFHPTQKPIQLYKWILTNYAKQGDKILDTHFGSLSIGIACHDLGFELTACELDKDYYEAGKKRLKQHQSQLTIFQHI
jgi:site-specific DNA-methyltransferase (adenine-specific)